MFKKIIFLLTFFSFFQKNFAMHPELEFGIERGVLSEEVSRKKDITLLGSFKIFNDISKSIAETLSCKIFPTDRDLQYNCACAIFDNLMMVYPSSEANLNLIVDNVLKSENIEFIADDFVKTLCDECYLDDIDYSERIVEFNDYNDVSVKDYVVEILSLFEKEPLLAIIAQTAKFVGKCGLGGLTGISGGLTGWNLVGTIAGTSVTAPAAIWFYGGVFIFSSLTTYKVFKD